MSKLFNLETAVEILLDGGVGVLPTDTVYGLVAAATHKDAVIQLYRLKNREHKPGTVIAADVQQLVELGLEFEDLKVAEHLWPDSLSVIIPADETLAYLHQGASSLAVRIPKDKKFRSMLKQSGPLLTSSANHPGEPPANSIQEAIAYFGESIDFYVDGGDLSGRKPSTVARIVKGTLEVIRPGAVIVD